MKRMKQLLMMVLMTFLVFAFVGCSENKEEEKEKQDYSIEETKTVKEIKNRGYLKVGVKDDVPGFGYYNTKKKIYEGGEVDLAYYLAAKIFDTTYEKAKSDDLVHFQTVTVNQREKVLQKHQVDYVIATYTITSDRKEKVSFSNSYYTDSVGIMVKKKWSDNNTLSDTKATLNRLDGAKIGVMKGATTRAALLRYIERNKVGINPIFMTYSSYDQLDKALSNGDIEAFSVDVSILNGYMTKNRELLSVRFAPQKYGVAAANDQDDLTDVVNIVLEELDYLGISLF